MSVKQEGNELQLINNGPRGTYGNNKDDEADAGDEADDHYDPHLHRAIPKATTPLRDDELLPVRTHRTPVPQLSTPKSNKQLKEPKKNKTNSNKIKDKLDKAVDKSSKKKRDKREKRREVEIDLMIDTSDATLVQNDADQSIENSNNDSREMKETSLNHTEADSDAAGLRKSSKIKTDKVKKSKKDSKDRESKRKDKSSKKGKQESKLGYEEALGISTPSKEVI